MHFINNLRIVLIILCVLPLFVLAESLDLTLFKTHKINEELYVFSQDYGANSINFAVVIGDKEAVLITTMMKEYSPHVQALIQQVTDKPIKYVLSLDGDYYQYFGSRYFVEKGATFVAHQALIPDVFEDRVLVAEPYLIELATEQILAIPTKAHTRDHMMVHLSKSNVVFAGDAISFHFLVYSGPNGPDAHIVALQEMLAIGNEETRYYPGNWVGKQSGNKQDLQRLLSIYSQFVELVRELNQTGQSPKKIAQSEQIHQLLKSLPDYDNRSAYIVDYVNDVLGIQGGE